MGGIGYITAFLASISCKDLKDRLGRSGLSKLISRVSDPGFFLFAHLTRKWRIARRLFRNEGTITLFVEIFCELCKPAVWLYDSLRWWWYQASGMKPLTVLGNRIVSLTKDPGISRELALYKVHEPLATRLLMQTLRPGMNVVDIGGDIGYYALLEARIVGPAGCVIAIEPMPRNFLQLCRNVQANGYRQIHTHQLAIGDRDGTAPLYLSRRSNWHSMHRNPSTIGQIQVAVRTLDSLLASYDLSTVDLVRMDLEGYEVVVINGMCRTIEKYGPRLLVELHPDLVGEQVTVEYLRTLRNLGYSVEWVFEQERDLPLHWRFLRIEKPTMSELTKDSRICSGPRAMTALFSRKVRQVPEESTD
jgi:FkbM family methyltransferase